MTEEISRRSLLGLGAAVAFSSSVAEPATNQANATAQLATIPRSEEFLLPSAKGQRYRIRIAYPLEIEPDLPLMIRGAKPVPIYVLDGGTNFGAVVTLSRLMQWGGELPPCLVVAIGYEDEEKADRLEYRRYDLTPTQNPDLDSYGKTTPGSWGGSAVFRRFLQKTLKPLIEKRFDVNRAESVLVGHSLAGMFALDTMVQDPTAFGNYLAMSPSLWFDHELVLKQLEDSLKKGVRYPGRVAVYVGDREERISEPKAQMTSNVLEFGRLVAKYRSQFAGVEVSILPKTSHHTVLGPAITQGLQFLISPPERRSETF
jgi:predicted alpha/beta superfamily hydrolase